MAGKTLKIQSRVSSSRRAVKGKALRITEARKAGYTYIHSNIYISRVYVYLVFGRIALCKVERFGIALIDKQYVDVEGWLVFVQAKDINW